MKFLTNIYDPNRPVAKQMILAMNHETVAQAWERQMQWLQGKVIGDPQATESYTVQELKARNIVGVYAPEVTQ